MGNVTWAWIMGIVATATPPQTELRRFEFTRAEMAVDVRLVFYTETQDIASTAADAAFARVRQLNAVLSDYDPQSELSRLCRSSGPGRPVRVSTDLWRVLALSQTWADRSGGAFDVTIRPVVRLWRRARRQQQLPDRERIQQALADVGYENIRLDPESRTVELLRPGISIDLGGIAKGYAADEARRVLEKYTIKSCLVDAGGDMVLGSPPPDREGWRIGVAPLQADGPPSRYLVLAHCAVATSGDAWQHVEIDGRRYSHIVDPRTGLGLTDHSSVTVVAPDGATADALASAVSVLGPEAGMKLVEATPGAAALIVRSLEGEVETSESVQWKRLRPMR